MYNAMAASETQRTRLRKSEPVCRFIGCCFVLWKPA